MSPQLLLLGISIALGMTAHRYATACNHRWRSAFLHINGALRFVDAQPVNLWLHLPIAQRKDPLQRRMWSQAVEKLTISDEHPPRLVTVDNTLTISGSHITYHDIFQMCEELEANAVEESRDSCGLHHVISGNITSSVIDWPVWRATAEFGIRCKERVSDARPNSR